MQVGVSIQPNEWLRNQGFDLTLIVGVTALALAVGALVAARPDVFFLILTLDLWLLGYHHVFSTYTRLILSRQDLIDHRWLIFGLPVVVVIGVVSLALGVGAWAVSTLYLYWQWWHYSRQSEGIAKAYAGKAAAAGLSPQVSTFDRAVFYLVPLSGILALSSRSPETFLFLPVKTLPVSVELATMFSALAAIGFAIWMVGRVRMYLAGRLPVLHTLFVLSHFVVFTVAYHGFDNPTRGWLVINVWHNAQYILFVWLFNTRRFQGRVDGGARLLSTLSLPRRFWLYMVFCLTMSTGLYTLFSLSVAPGIASTLGVTSLMAGVILYQSINFHHYVVDALIWKLRKPAVGRQLGLATAD